MIRAIGFDIGDTLLFYGEMPLDWSSCYEDALSVVAGACGVSPSASQFAAAREILAHYNTRVRPRTEEVAADEIFALVLRSWAFESAERVVLSVDAFFMFFQQRMCPFSETLSVLRTLRSTGARLGALTDVPYGMPHKFVERDLDQAEISQFMDAVVTSAMVGVRKPEVAGYEALATALAVKPDEMLYVGNEPKMLSARAAPELRQRFWTALERVAITVRVSPLALFLLFMTSFAQPPNQSLEPTAGHREVHF